MKTIRLLVSALVLLTCNIHAHADDGVISDLPGFETDGGSAPSQPNQPQTPVDPPVPAAVSPGSVTVPAVSRKAGGTSYLVKLDSPRSLKRLEVRIISGQVKIYEAYLITTQGRQISVRYFNNTDVLNEGSRYGSESLNQNDRVVSMIFMMEAFGGSSSINIAAIAENGLPYLTLDGVTPPNMPAPPASTPPPPVSVGGKEGTRVIDTSGRRGNVLRVLSNSKAIIEFDDYAGEYARNISELGIAVRCVKDICKGSRALDANGSWGEVQEIFNNGVAVLEFDQYSGYYVRKVNDLGLGVKCIKGFCVNNRVIDGNESWGEILEVFTNGMVRIEFDNYSGEYLRNISNLGLSVRCLQDVCVKSRAIDANGSYGDILEVYSNGKVRMEFDAYSGEYIRATRNIGLGLRCVNGLCAKDRIVDSNNTAGEIVEIFSNGMTVVEYDQYSGTYVRQVGTLRKRK
ncbi:MAG: beta-sandwich domain-containing protein [Bdellovibrio sp.]|nr:beta-sandwich domain-containing protein [Bdellovibrio sp.]